VNAIAETASRSATADDGDTPLLTQERHRFAIARALDEAKAFRTAWSSGEVPAPVAAVHLREAVTTLEDLIGAVDVEDVLDEVFRRFCVGK
jgi:tRNA modification GTPase